MGTIIANVVALVIVLAVVGGAVYYIYKNRKKGVKCIGCPYAATCNHGCTGQAKQPENKKEMKEK
jgi:radical SAM protein with 4Fe4S-binding SPASM domain